MTKRITAFEWMTTRNHQSPPKRRKIPLPFLGDAVNKSEWIRQQPDSMKASALIALAAEQGITITAQQIYTTRYEQKKREKLRQATVTRGMPQGSDQDGDGPLIDLQVYLDQQHFSD